MTSFATNRMLINLLSRKTGDGYNHDERILLMEDQMKQGDRQVAYTFGSLAEFPIVFTLIPYLEFLLDHPTIFSKMTRAQAEMIVGNSLFTRMMLFLLPIALAMYLYSRQRADTLQNGQAIEDFLGQFEWHSKKLHNLLSGGSTPSYIPNIILGTSMETDDYVIQDSNARRQNSVWYGPIGSGKTSTIFIPQIKQDIDSYLQYIRDYKYISKDPTWMKSRGKAFQYLNGFNVIDPTNDLCKEVYELCMKMGVPKDRVIWIDPENERTPGMNLLRGPVEKAAENVTNIISGLKGGNNDFFRQSERTHLKNYIYLLKLSAVMTNSIASFGELIRMYNDIELVYEKMTTLDKYVDILAQKSKQAEKQAQEQGDEQSIIDYKEMSDKYQVAWQTSQWFHTNVQTMTSGKNVKTYPSGPHQGDPMHYDAQEEYVKGLRNTLDDISKNIPLRRVLFRDDDDFNLDDFLHNGGILLCSTAKAAVGDQLAEILGQIYTLSFQAATFRRIPNTEPMHPLYADEFPDYLSESFSAYAAQARKYNVPIIIAAQSPAQLAYKYGSQYFDTLMTVMLTRGTFGDMGANDAKLLEPLFGEKVVTTESVNDQDIDIGADLDSNRRMLSTRRETVPNISANGIMGLERFTVAVRTPGQHGSDMFNRIRVQRITDKEIANDPYVFDSDNPEDMESYRYMVENETHNNPDFDEIDKSIIKEIQNGQIKMDTDQKPVHNEKSAQSADGSSSPNPDKGVGQPKNSKSSKHGSSMMAGVLSGSSSNNNSDGNPDDSDSATTSNEPSQDTDEPSKQELPASEKVEVMPDDDLDDDMGGNPSSEYVNLAQKAVNKAVQKVGKDRRNSAIHTADKPFVPSGSEKASGAMFTLLQATNNSDSENNSKNGNNQDSADHKPTNENTQTSSQATNNSDSKNDSENGNNQDSADHEPTNGNTQTAQTDAKEALLRKLRKEHFEIMRDEQLSDNERQAKIQQMMKAEEPEVKRLFPHDYQTVLQGTFDQGGQLPKLKTEGDKTIDDIKSIVDGMDDDVIQYDLTDYDDDDKDPFVNQEGVESDDSEWY
ncbi:type IV secretion system DNA-binding domain-containing protein [Limosilactobacillus mucosae]|uniref:Type IV secretion system DNA-binding domain-containing protein n=1 Tax=Limosilactobacillus mucosae TaxID=97478 RepID=A0AAJ1HQW3_LIMMU|nr:type IV secretion system DNA-binding domain-containing protein [Limosilactobacillus mucosae]MDC2829073.1 type IV secretion system DNA-binding domain-containing protein [Limosilactobacillus mucosae]